jgi:hypothetical protein
VPKLSLVLPQTPRYTLARARVPLSLLATPVDKARRDEEGCALIDIDQADRIVLDRGVQVTEPLPSHEDLAEALRRPE